MAFMTSSPVLQEERFRRESTPYGQGGMTYAARQDTMTVGGAVTATGVLMVLLVGAGVFGWTRVVQEKPGFDEFGRQITTQPAIPSWIFGAVLVALVLGLVTAFVPKAARITAPLYALAMGTWVGAISAVYNSFYDGIVAQAAFATIGIFTAMYFLYATRIIKVTNRFVLIVAGATMGIFVMYLFAWIARLLGAELTFLTSGSPLGIGISVVIIGVAALRLAIDFAFIEKAAQHAAPKYLEWYAGFGVMVNIVWIYLELLRLFAMLQNRR
jgi:uncharacterized YccA/Bax inhibitor family protein